MMIMSMWWDYVSELWPPTVCCSFPGWYMSTENHGGIISAGENWFVHQSCGTPISRDISTNQEELGEGYDEFSLRNFCSYFEVIILHAAKSYSMGPTPLFRSEGRCVPGFVIVLNNPSPRSCLNLWTLGSSDKHANHYTTEAHAHITCLIKDIDSSLSILLCVKLRVQARFQCHGSYGTEGERAMFWIKINGVAVIRGAN
jgi:hypothetical protein